LFFPQNAPPDKDGKQATIPCPVTVKDLKGKQYKIILSRPQLKTDPPTSPADDAQKSCAGITPLEILGWCNRTNGPKRVATDDPIKWGFSTPPVLPDNNTHDFNNDDCIGDFFVCGRSDILWRFSNGGVVAWLQLSNLIVRSFGIGTLDPNIWTI